MSATWWVIPLTFIIFFWAFIWQRPDFQAWFHKAIAAPTPAPSPSAEAEDTEAENGDGNGNGAGDSGDEEENAELARAYRNKIARINLLPNHYDYNFKLSRS